jgi:putative FmdB family regulatory protein
MPINLYICGKCGHLFESPKALNEKDSELKCPECGAKEPEKVRSAGGGAFSFG